ncbi:Fur family transcriptional regulator [Neisseria sp. Ec49-e6-T10]|uniref:Fur family transcriptional regulator n=1 Tax=Neisseria sp. Ec49-e6-T10 TaxID=3140744 RepID=UPI003EBD633E
MSMNAHTNQLKQHILKICAENQAQVTPLREAVLDLLLKHDGVLKAYQLLNDMQLIRKNVAPPTVYRALDFWVEQGVLHKVNALNGYVLCQHPDHPHQGVILLCDSCHHIFEECDTPKLRELKEELAQKGFTVDMQQMVLTGVCQSCQTK